MTQIIEASLGLTALRQAGYKSTATAVAELVDNSIEANAQEIDIIVISRRVQLSSRESNQVEKICVLDNGDGMTLDVLSKCLSLGWGTRLNTREGLGRFGFGLKGASISQARRVDVYSWIEPNQVCKAYLDLDEIKENRLSELPEVTTDALPPDIVESFSDKLRDSGTLVVWSELDQMNLRRAGTLQNRINDDLCRVYRHFLDDDNEYGHRRAINIHTLQAENNSLGNSVRLKANDPLYQLVPNNLPGFETEPTNEPFCDSIELGVKYLSGGQERESKVKIRFSVAKPSIQKLGGNSEVGKHYRKNTGISFVRAGREIDFGSFGFFDTSEYRHRWWGAEVRFEPVLDELFGVTNDKQQVRAIKKEESEVLQSFADDGHEDNYGARLLIDLSKILDEHIGQMISLIKGRRSGERTKKDTSGLTERVNKDVKTSNRETESEKHAEKLTEEQKTEERIKILLTDDETLSRGHAAEIAKETIDYRVDISTDRWPGDLFLDRRLVANASVGIINRDTQFYELFWNYLDEQDDRKGFEALEVLIMALVRAEDELVRTHDKEVFELYRQRWSSWVEQLIRHAGN